MMISPLMSLKSFMFFVTISYSLVLHFILAEEEPTRGFRVKERDALYGLKAALNDPFLNEAWAGPHCRFNASKWYGIKCSFNGDVQELVLENMGLRGNIITNAFSIDNLAELSVLSFKNNSLSGTITDFNFNRKLTRVDLSGNSFSGQIPISLVRLPALELVLLQDNFLTGPVPGFNQSSLKEFNISNNNLTGPIPETPALKLFGFDSYSGNPGLSGNGNKNDVSPTDPPTDIQEKTTDDHHEKSFTESLKSNIKKYLLIVDVVLLILVILLFVLFCKKQRKLIISKSEEQAVVLKATDHKRDDHQDHDHGNFVDVEGGERSSGPNNITSANNNDNSGGGQERGKLVFVGNVNGADHEDFEMSDLLKASAEGLGQGTFGNSYKATMEGKAAAVVVKRLRDLKPLTAEEFRKHLLLVASQRHPNLLPLLAYYDSKNQKLLLYKYIEKGNLFSRIHEGRGTKERIPFRWGSRLSVARGVGRALEYLHLKLSFAVPHGNLKSTNILLDDKDGVLVCDYGLSSLMALPVAAQRTVAYRSPEYQSTKRVSRKSDVWSYGCLLLELLTGRVVGPGFELCSWVQRAVREEWTAEIFDSEIRASASASMLRLLEISLHCIDKSPEKRPEMSEVVNQIHDLSDHDHSQDDVSFTDDSISSIASVIINH